mmetsp:Transcript_131822/g.320325  ORF Transcript_131822/g.320325 Transcript_131822/m.320325 type:complete len:297 (+) Transcript_131822:903-1793(+)
MRSEVCKYSPAFRQSASAVASRLVAPWKAFRKAHAFTRSAYMGMSTSRMRKASGASQAAPSSSLPLAAAPAAAVRRMDSSAGAGRFASRRSTLSGIRMESSMVTMASSAVSRSGMRASMHQTCRRRCSSSSRRGCPRSRSAGAVAAWPTPPLPASPPGPGVPFAKSASSSSRSKHAPRRCTRSQTVPSSAPSREMGVQKRRFTGTRGRTSGWRGSRPFPPSREPPAAPALPLPLPGGESSSCSGSSAAASWSRWRWPFLRRLRTRFSDFSSNSRKPQSTMRSSMAKVLPRQNVGTR